MIYWKQEEENMSDKPGRNDFCWCGSGRKYKKCHAPIEERMDACRSEGYEVPHLKLLKTQQQIEGIRESGKRNTALLDFIGDYVADGVTTEELDRLIDTKTREFGGIPATLHYNGYPKSVCVSIDDVVCHGIPSNHVIRKKGDIVNIDVSTI